MDTYAVGVACVPLVAADVSSGAVAGSLAAALRGLGAAAEKLFFSIETKIDAERDRLACIAARIAAARKRIDAMTGEGRAAHVAEYSVAADGDTVLLAGGRLRLDDSGGVNPAGRLGAGVPQAQ